MLVLPGLDQAGDPRRLGAAAVAEDDDPPLQEPAAPGVMMETWRRVRVMQPSQIKVAFSGRLPMSGKCCSPARQYLTEIATSISTSTKATAILLISNRKSTKVCSP